MISFILAAFFLVVTPGPGVLSTAGVGAAYGFRAGLPYLSGIILGSLLVMAAVATGLAAFLFSYPPLRTILLALSAAYLLYIAFRIATSAERGSGASPWCQAPVPAESTRTRSARPSCSKRCAKTPSPSGERQMLPKQTKRTETS